MNSVTRDNVHHRYRPVLAAVSVNSRQIASIVSPRVRLIYPQYLPGTLSMSALRDVYMFAVGGDVEQSLSKPGPARVAQLFGECGLADSEEQ
eukprot:3959275-Lingulodinium_polyedra.AAC.1